MTRFLVHLFGDFAISDQDGDNTPLNSWKAQAALIALCVSPGGAISRSQLILSLWPDALDEKARNSMRSALRQIRAVLGEAAVETVPGGRLQLNTDLVSTDVDRLSAAIESRRWRDASGAAPTAGTLQFWRSPTTEFEEWVSDQRRACDAVAASRLLDGAANAQREGAFAEAARLAEAALAIDSHNEAALRIGIKSFCQQGELSQARRMYEATEQRLRDELGVDLSDATKETLDREIAAAASGRRKQTSMDGVDDRPMVIISPFRPLDSGQGNEYLGIGLAEELLSRLSRNKWLHIVADGMPGTYKPPNTTTYADEFARSKYLVGGVYLATPRAVRLTVRVTNVHQQKEIWGARYDAEISDLMKIQDELSQRLASQIEPELQRAEETASMQTDERDLKDWTQIMRARHLFWRTQFKTNQKAIFLLEEVLKRRPDDVQALVTLSFALLLNVWSYWTDAPEEALEESERAARRAVRIADQDPWTHFTLGTCLLAKNKIIEAEQALSRALEMHPTFAGAKGEFARLLLFKGELDRAFEEAVEAVSISPTDPHVSLAMNTAGFAALLRGDTELALSWALRAAGANSHWFHHQLLLALCYHAMGKRDIAREKLQIAKKMTPKLRLSEMEWSHPFQDPDLKARHIGPLLDLDGD